MKRKGRRGGRREGAGRPPVDGVGARLKSVWLTRAHVALVERHQEEGTFVSFSEALRDLIELATESTREVRR